MPVATIAGEVVKAEVFFDDLDAFGVVSNVRYPVLLQRALAGYMARLGYGYGHEDHNCVIRSFGITFEKPLARLGAVDIALWAESLGRMSGRLGFRFASGETVHAHGHYTLVKIDPVTMRPAPWSPGLRQLVAERLLIAERKP